MRTSAPFPPCRYVAKQRQFPATFKNVHLCSVFASLAGAAAARNMLQPAARHRRRRPQPTAAAL